MAGDQYASEREIVHAIAEALMADGEVKKSVAMVKAYDALDAFKGGVKLALKHGGMVVLHNFGTFYLQKGVVSDRRIPKRAGGFSVKRCGLAYRPKVSFSRNFREELAEALEWFDGPLPTV